MLTMPQLAPSRRVAAVVNMSYQFPQSRILLFTKAPEIGKVKTRLIPSIGAVAACDLHKYLLLSLLRRVTEAAIAPVQLWCSPNPDNPFIRECQQRFALEVFNQQGVDLGQRMLQALRKTLDTQHAALVIGADCISLSTDDMSQALCTVQQENCVALHPAEDGGYVSIAMNYPHTQPFHNIDWGSERVLEQTKARAEQAGITLRCLATRWDLDTPEDLQRSGIDVGSLAEQLPVA